MAESLHKDIIYEETKNRIHALFNKRRIDNETLGNWNAELTKENAETIMNEINKSLEKIDIENLRKIQSITGPIIKVSIIGIPLLILLYFSINYLRNKFSLKNRFLDLVGKISGYSVIPSVFILLFSAMNHINFQC